MSSFRSVPRTALTVALLAIACSGDDGSGSESESADSGTDPSTTGVDTTSTSTTDPSTTSTATTNSPVECGNGMVEGIEECDDMNDVNGDGCNVDCTAYVDSLLWSQTHGGMADVQEAGTGVAADSAGNVIVAGWVVDVLGDQNIFVRKYDADGNELWTQTVDGGAMGDDRACGVTVDANDNILVTGDTFIGMSNSDIWVAQYSPDGTEVWSTTYDGPNGETDNGTEIAVDSSNDVLVSGFVRAATNDNDMFVGKFSGADGAVVWDDVIPGPDTLDDRARGVAVDPDDNVFVAGYITMGVGSNDVWLRKYDSGGAEIWTQTWDSANSGSDRGFDVAAAPDGSVVVTGFTPVNANNENIWVSRWNADGEIQWFQTYGGPAVVHDHGFGVAINADNEVFVTGFKSVSQTDTDIWLRKWDPGGAPVWTQAVLGDANDLDQGNDVAVDASGNILVTGEIRNSGNNGDIWVGKFGPNP